MKYSTIKSLKNKNMSMEMAREFEGSSEFIGHEVHCGYYPDHTKGKKMSKKSGNGYSQYKAK
jgi:hypothetical protein